MTALGYSTAGPVSSGGSGAVSDEASGDYLPISRLKRQYTDYLGVADAEIREQKEARRYYHGSQWTSEEIDALKKRKQPVVTFNRVVRKIDAVVGLVEKLRQDPKAYARTPQHEQGAELATAVIRYVLDNNDWKSKSTRIARQCAVEAIAGIEYDIQPGDQGDPDLALHIVYGDTFFYDKRSYDEGFSDVRYCGVAKWVDIEQAKELVPDKAGDIDSLMEQGGSDMTTFADREIVWANTNEKRVRLVDHWYIKNGEWRWTLYISNTVLMQGTSPFRDEKGKTFPKYRMFSASVDQDGDRYGFVRNLKSPQDEINHRRSKALHNLNVRRLIVEKGAVDDIEVARREWARPDGVVEKNPGLEVEPDPRQAEDIKGQFEFLQEAKNEIENFGPNPALIGQGLEDSSGRAISLLQQAGLAELGPFLSAWKNWKVRVYRDIWNIIKEHWKAERWIRVTDDDGVAQHIQINGLQLGPDGTPQIVNALGSLDVDVILDEGPDEVNMMADSYATLQSLGPQFAQEFPEYALQLSPLPNSVKKPMIDEIKKKKMAPPAPDPKMQVMQAQVQLDAQKQQNEMQFKQASMQLEQAKAEHDAQVAQQTAEHSLAAEAAKIQSAAQLKREEMLLDAQLKREQMELDLHTEGQRMEMQVHTERQKGDVQMQIHRDKVTSEQEVNKAKDNDPAVKSVQQVTEALRDLQDKYADLRKAVTAPRRLIRDKQGRPVGAETVERQSA